MPEPLPAYEGQAPYVFVSYSHADDREVYGQIRWMQEQGLNVWYDTAGINAGAEWNDEIARAIKGATCFIFFVTPQSVASEHCRRELNFAQTENIPIIVVQLQATEIPDGLRLSLENRQALSRYQMPSARYERAFLKALSVVDPQLNNDSGAQPVAAAAARPMRWVRVFAILLTVTVVAAAVWLSTSNRDDSVPPGPSIAVLPFIDLSPGGDQQHIGDGIAEEILDKLTGLDGLRVAARTSSFAFRAREEDLREISATLNVNSVLEGSVRRDGDRIRITAQLIDAEDGFHLWSRTYERQLTDLFAIQTDIAEAVAGNLGVTLGVGDINAFRGAGTQNIEAYESYLQAQRLGASIPERIRLLERAASLDPKYAAAWSELGLTIASTMWASVPEQAPAIIDRAVPHLMRAVELEPDSAHAYNLLATVYYARLDWIRSEEYFQQALGISPDRAVLGNYGNMHMRAGRSSDALRAYTTVLQEERPSLGLGTNYIHAYVALGRTDEILHLIESLPVSVRLYLQFLIALNEGDPPAVRNSMLELENASGAPQFGPLLDHFSNPEKALTTLKGASENPNVWPSKYHDLALLAAYFGDPELSLKLISVEARLTTIRLGVLWYPVMREVRRLEGFEALLNDINLPDYWREYGWSDHCRPTGELDFECF